MQCLSVDLVIEMTHKSKDFHTIHLCLITRYHLKKIFLNLWTSQVFDLCLSFLLVGLSEMILKASSSLKILLIFLLVTHRLHSKMEIVLYTLRYEVLDQIGIHRSVIILIFTCVLLYGMECLFI